MSSLPPRPFYTPGDLAPVIGQSVRTVRMVLRERFPSHTGWWRLSRADAVRLVEDLREPDDKRRRGGLRYHRK
jgi:alkylated DNA nucleotide flippase Atl1